MIPQHNKRKASASPSPPTTPRAVPPTTGAHFFLPSFASPNTMPKKAATPSLEYLYSPTPATPHSAPLPRDTLSQEQITPLPGALPVSPDEEDMDLSNSYDALGGLENSMHAPLRNTTPTPSTPLPPPTPLPAPTFAQRLLAAQQSSGQAATHATMPQTPSLGPGQKAAQQNAALPPPMATDFTIQDESLPLPQDESLPHQDTSHLTPSLINTLSAIAESSIDMISVGTTGPSNESHFTPPPANNFPITHRGIPGEFLIGLSPETVTAWCEVPSPKFFIRIFDYDGSNARARHASLIRLVRIAIQEIAKTKGYADVDARIAPPTAPPHPNDPPPYHIPRL